MGQPTPPGDMPLYEGLSTEWNDIVGAFPEDQRATLAPKLKERIDAYQNQIKPWEDLNKSGITPEQATQALDVYNVLNTNPRQVYDTLANYLGITPAEAKEVVEAVEDGDGDDPRIAQMQQQIDTLAKIRLAEHEQSNQEKLVQAENKRLEKEFSDLRNKYGDIDEMEILMRMSHLDMTPEQAYQDYAKKVTELRTKRPAPMLLGSGGAVPSRAIDPTKMSSAQTKDIVAQMMQAAIAQNKQ